MAQQIDETLESSQLIKAEGEESVRGSFNEHKEMSVSGMRCSILTESVNSEISGSQDFIIGSLSGNRDEESQENDGNNMFLERICELSQ